MDTVDVSNNDTNRNSNSNSHSLGAPSDKPSTNIPGAPVGPVTNPQPQPPLPLLTAANHRETAIHSNISPLPLHPMRSRQFSITKTAPYPATTTAALPHSLPPPPSLTKNNGNGTPTIERNNQNLFQSLYNRNVTGMTPHNHVDHHVTPSHVQTTPIISNANNTLHKTPSGYHHTQDTKMNLRRGRPKKSSHSHRKAFEAGHPRFERALQQLIEMRQKHPQGLLPSIRGFMQTIHMGFANTNAVVKYYANNYLNMTLDDFKRDYMVIRRVRAKSRTNSGGRPKKTSPVQSKMKYDDKSESSGSDSDDLSSRHRISSRHRHHHHHHHHPHHRKRNKAPLQPLKQPIFSQFLMNQSNNNHNHNHNNHNNNLDFNFPLFFEGIANNESGMAMPKLIADNIKMEQEARVAKSEFEANEFIGKLENDLAVLMELQDTNDGGVNSVSPEDIKKPLSVVRKRLLTMLDRSLYHQLDHAQKVTIAKANLIAGICTAAIHTGYCKDALALYRQSLTLFRELNSDAASNGYPMGNARAELETDGKKEHESKSKKEKKNIDAFILNLIANCNSNEQDPGKYSMFIVVIYYQMSLLYDKSLIEKVQKSRYYLIQALNLLVRENAMNSNKYCIETLQRLALFALETGKDSEYISMMLITLRILRECDENRGKILDVEIHFAKNLLSYGHQLPNTNAPQQRERFESVKAEYQKLLTQIIADAKQGHSPPPNANSNANNNTETRRTLSKLLELAKFLLDYNQLNESYKVYHCMRKMCDDTQINLDLDFMKIWIQFVKTFIAQIVKHNANNHVMRHGNNGATQTQSTGTVLWSEQILELCEFDVKVLEKIQQTTDIQIGTDIYNEYISCSKALCAVNIDNDSHIMMRCKSYLDKAQQSPNEEIKKEAKALFDSITQQSANQNDEN